MKRLYPLIVSLSLLLGQSCTCPPEEEDVAPTTGVSGQVLYGAGDCMPLIDEAARTYQGYTGELYFIRKADAERPGSGSFDQLKSVSLHYLVQDGKLRALPPPDTYLVTPADYYTNAYTLTLTAGQGLRQDFKFWRCLTY